MTGSYAYTPAIWLMIVSIAWLGFLTWYAWRNRLIPWAIPSAVLTGTAVFWILGNTFEIAATEMPTKINWFIFQDAASIPLAIAGLWFTLEYAGLHRWATPRNLVLLLVPQVVRVTLYFVDDHLLWTRFWLDGTVRGALSPLGLIFNAYNITLLLLTMAIMLVLFARSPLHRWPIGLLLGGQLAVRIGYLLQIANVIVSPVKLGILSADFASLIFALAIFRFQFFLMVPIGRELVIERMTDGMLVLNVQGRVVDLNPAAEKLLGRSRANLTGQPATQILAGLPALLQFIMQPTMPGTTEIQIGEKTAPRWYQINRSPIISITGFCYGELLVLRDISELKHTQQRLIQEQRSLAALREQQVMARELHDELAQELAFINLQAQTAQELLAAHKIEEAAAYLARLENVADQAHTNIRGMISSLMTTAAPEQGLPEMLGALVQEVSQRYGNQIEFVAANNQSAILLDPAAEVQCLRIVQEAITNARKHARARHIQVSLASDASGTVVSVEDDGIGFDPTHLTGGKKGFGLQIIRERAEEIGGTLEMVSSPECGTRITVRLPADIKEPTPAN